jgi:hypothetical protein
MALDEYCTKTVACGKHITNKLYQQNDGIRIYGYFFPVRNTTLFSELSVCG